MPSNLTVRHDRELLAAIIESSDDAIASKDLNGIVTSWNPGAERIFGYKAEEIVGRPILMIIPPELHKDEEVILSKLRRGERIEHFETIRVTKDRRRIHVSLTVSPIRNPEGTVIGAAKIARDITERKHTEEALRRAEMMAATGQLAATIAHEINNPMQALTNVIALVSREPTLGPQTREFVILGENELNRVAHITRQMLALYRDSARAVPIRLTRVIEDTLEVLVLNWRAKHIDVERQYDFDDYIESVPIDLRQILANLLSNAAEAVPEGGRIRIHVMRWHDWTREGRMGVRIVIADNGPGIDQEIEGKVFDPFFTTKEQKGSGLGLWVAKGIVTKHQGSLHLKTSTTRGRSGTVVSIFLPTNVKEMPAKGQAADSGRSAA